MNMVKHFSIFSLRYNVLIPAFARDINWYVSDKITKFTKNYKKKQPMHLYPTYIK